MATLTPEQMAAKLNARMEQILKFNIPFQKAVKAVTALQAIRIFTNGINSSAQQIGSYNQTDPIYVSDENSPRNGTHVGKKGKTVVKSSILAQNIKTKKGVTRTKKEGLNKTTYYSSYKSFKQTMKGKSDKVNLKLFNELQSDFSNQNISAFKGKGQSPHNPVQISVNEYHITLNKEIDRKKAEGMEDKYGKIFSLTKKERNIFKEVLQKEMSEAMSK